MWRGSELPTVEQGIKVLGTPIGHHDYVLQMLSTIQDKHRVLLMQFPQCQISSQFFCCSFTALQHVNHYIRVVRPNLVDNFAQSHDQGLWQCLCTIMDVPADGDPVTRATANLPFSLGGLGLRSAQRTREAAYWASLSDTLPMIHARHPVVANLLVRHLDGDSWSPSLRAASQAATELDLRQGFEVPSWSDVAGGLRPPDRDPEDHEPGGSRKGWQHEASGRVEQDFRESLFTGMTASDRALARSQSGPGAGVAFSASPSSILTRIEAPLFRVLVQRRLRLPLPLSHRICGCGLSIDSLGHHRAACSRTGAFGKKRIRSGKRTCKGLQGSMRTGGHKLVRPQHGLGRPKRWRQQTAGGRR